MTNATAVVAKKPNRITGNLAQYGTVLALVGLILIFFAAKPGIFLTFNNVRNILFQVAILAIVAAAQTVVMVVGDFDLSVGSTGMLAGTISGQLMLLFQMPVPLAILVGILSGVLIGVLNGVMVAYLGISAFIATLAVYTSQGGLILLITGGSTIFGFPEGFNFLGQGKFLEIPLPVYFAILICLLLWWVLRYTTIGRRWYAVGGNSEVSRLSGVGVRRTRFLAFVVTSTVSAIAGILLVARLGSAAYGGDGLIMMYSVAAVFLGMTILKSGKANIGGSIIGVGIIGVLSNGMNILQVNSYLQQVITGIIIILAVTFSAIKNRGRQ